MAASLRAPYFDPNTNMRYDTNNADFEGGWVGGCSVAPLAFVLAAVADGGVRQWSSKSCWCRERGVMGLTDSTPTVFTWWQGG